MELNIEYWSGAKLTASAQTRQVARTGRTHEAFRKRSEARELSNPKRFCSPSLPPPKLSTSKPLGCLLHDRSSVRRDGLLLIRHLPSSSRTVTNPACDSHYRPGPNLSSSSRFEVCKISPIELCTNMSLEDAIKWNSVLVMISYFGWAP
jgi:hypothetical protein